MSDYADCSGTIGVKADDTEMLGTDLLDARMQHATGFAH